MNTRWMWLYLSGLAVAALLADVAWCYPQLPQQVPLHFDSAGRPDGWGAKQELLGWSLGTVVIMAVLLSPAILLMKFLPPSLINLPRHDYWLAPEREAATRQAMMDRMGWFVGATMVFITLQIHSWLHAAFRQPPRIESPMVSLVIFLAFVATWLTELLWRFCRRPE